jgi:hypothetical protein
MKYQVDLTYVSQQLDDDRMAYQDACAIFLFLVNALIEMQRRKTQGAMFPKPHTKDLFHCHLRVRAPLPHNRATAPATPMAAAIIPWPTCLAAAPVKVEL